MKPFTQKEILKNIFVLSDMEIAVIAALTFCNPAGMTPKAQKVCYDLRDQFITHSAIGSKNKVWVD